MKLFQNKIVVGVICIVIAAILAFLFLPSISKSKSNTEKIYVVKNAVHEGTKIEESMLTEKEVGSYGLPQSIIKDKDKIVGKYASCDITPDDFILSSKLSEFAANGKDAVSFLVSANPGEPLLPLSKIASGGELSRTMLALKCALADKEKTPTLIFDEIDTGISGKTSHKIGIKLKEVASRNTQVICVTHSPQITATADTHFFVSKREVDGRAQTSVRLIEGEERVAEAARILGGINVTEAQKQAARDMIENISE